MTPTPSTISVSFTAHYSGIHRICYRIQGSGAAYTCVDSDVCVDGDPCTHTIPIVVSIDSETCDPVVWEGYVQPTCYSLLSTNGRVAWTCTYTPDQPCDSYMLECTSVGVSTLNITEAGSGYDNPPADPPIIQFFPIDGNGSGAIAVAVVNGGIIDTVTVTNPGSGYTAPPIVSIDSPIGGGTQALLEIDQMLPCETITYTQCSDVVSPNIEMDLGQGAIFCDDGDLATQIIGTGYEMTADGCCYDCVDVVFTVGTEDADIYYRECGGDIVETLSVTKLTTLSATCVVRDSWYWTPQFEPGGDPDVTVAITEPTPGEDPCWWPVP